MRRPGAASLFWIATGCAVLSIFVAAAPLPRRFAGDSGLPPPASTPPPAASAEPVSIDPILQLSPFGRIIRAVSGAPAPQETTSGLILHGVVIATRPENSTAIVSGPGVPARVYHIGETIIGSTSIETVFVDHVMLLVDGRPESLSFPQAGTTDARSPAAPDEDLDALRELIAGAAAEYSAAVEPAPSGDAPEQARAPDDITATVDRYRRAMRDDPQMVLDQLGLVAFEDGYRVAMTASDELRSTGLLPGDVVVSVNGQQVGTIERDQARLDNVIASGRATIIAIRQGERVMVSLPLR